MIILKIIGVLLEIIGVVLLIILAAMCIPVRVGVQYDSSFTVRIKYLFIKYTFDGAAQGDKSENGGHKSVFAILNTLLVAVASPFVWIFGGIKKFFSKIAASVKRIAAALKKKFKKNLNSKQKKDDTQGAHKAKSKKDKRERSVFGSLRDERGFLGAIGFFVEIGKAFGGSMWRIYRGVAVDKFTLRLDVSGEDAADTAIKYGEVCRAAFPALSFLLMSARRYNQDIDINPNFGNDGSRIYFDGEFLIYPILVVGHFLGAAIGFLISQVKVTLSNNRERQKG